MRDQCSLNICNILKPGSRAATVSFCDTNMHSFKHLHRVGDSISKVCCTQRALIQLKWMLKSNGAPIAQSMRGRRLIAEMGSFILLYPLVQSSRWLAQSCGFKAERTLCLKSVWTHAMCLSAWTSIHHILCSIHSVFTTPYSEWPFCFCFIMSHFVVYFALTTQLQITYLYRQHHFQPARKLVGVSRNLFFPLIGKMT